MTGIEKQITDVINELSLEPTQIRRLHPEEGAQIIQAAHHKFVEGRPRSWWLSLKVPYTAIEYAYASGFRHLAEHWQSKDINCWFIPETEEAELPVYETTIDVLPRLLEECSFFEYYVLNKDCSLLIIESDHNQVITAQS